MAKPDLEYPSTFGSQYDVFLSFRGKDTRKNFTDHLYEALVRSGFRIFRDDDEIKRGEAIRLELERGIEKSLLYIVIFSKTYASSKWCLEELVMITSAASSGGRHVVLPIFYDVDVEQLKIWRKGNFEEALKDAADIVDDRKLNLWREALKKASKFAGLVLQNEADGHEAKFIKNIVQEVGNKLNRRLLNVPDQIIGMDSTVEKISSVILDDKSKSAAGVIMICGMAGIGKTTLAHVVYNMHYRVFEDHTILPDIQNRGKELNDLVELQKQLLSNITGRQESISCLEEGIEKIQRAMCFKRVLLVLDDVNQEKQLSAAFGSITKLTSNGSKIIITTKNQGLLRTEGEASYCKIEVPLLHWKDALELFSWHAFRQNHPMEDYLELSNQAVNCSGCLPLALKVLGSSLFDRPTDFWNNVLKKLKAVPDTDVMEKLQVSFECLQGKEDRELFLDIACFFVGRSKDFATRILDGCDLYASIGIQNLIDRSLLTIRNNHISMHQLIQDMGRKIVFEESRREPGNRSRVWDHKDSFDVLREKNGTKEIEGMILDMHMLKDDDSTMTELETEAFVEMRNLRLLELNHVKISGNFDGFPKRLRWLCCHGFPLQSLPNDFPIEKLVVLEMQHSNLKQLWSENKFVSKLEILDLSYSQELKKTPDFSRLVHLQILILEECPNLIEVHESIGKLKRLNTINLKNCISLKKLPKEIGMLNNLESLIISGCSSLSEWPNEIGEMKSLKELFADGVGISDVKTISWYSSIINWALSKWEYKSNKGIVPSISCPSTLTHLSLKGCNLGDDAFSSMNSISLPQLSGLNLSGNMISFLPEVVKSCVSLKTLNLEQCPKLKSIVGLQNMGFRRVGHSVRYYLECKACPKLVEIETCFKLEPINNNDIELLGKWGFSNLESIINTKIRYCNLLSSLKIWKYTSDRLLQAHSGGHTTEELPLQRLYNYNGVYSYFLPGIEIPSGFFRSRCKIEEIKKDSMLESYGFWCRPQREPLQVSLVVQKFGDGMKRLPGLIICFVYNGTSELICDIENRTKHLSWRHRPHYVGLARNNEEDMVWVSHWNFGNNSHRLVDDGDVIWVKVEERGSVPVKELAVGLNTFESTTSPTLTPIDSFLFETAVPIGGNYDEPDYSGGIDFRGHM